MEPIMEVNEDEMISATEECHISGHCASKTTDLETYDTIIIGGGIAGLSLAVELRDRGKAEHMDAKILVLEECSDVGGTSRPIRSTLIRHTTDVSAKQENSPSEKDVLSHIQMTGSWIGEKSVDPLVHEWIDRYGLIAEKEQFAGPESKFSHVLLTRGESNVKSGFSLKNLTRGMARADLKRVLHKMQKLIETDQLWERSTSPKVTEEIELLDATSVKAFTRNHTNFQDVRDIVDHVVRMLFHCESTQLSMLGFLYHLKQSNDFHRFFDLDAVRMKIVSDGGMRTLCSRIADSIISTKGCDVRVHSSVKYVSFLSSGLIEVETNEGLKYLTRSIVFASINSLKNIETCPALPTRILEFSSHSFPGATFVFWIAFKEPWWRTHQLSGRGVNLHPEITSNALNWTEDYSDDSRRSYALRCVAQGDMAVELKSMSPAERRKTVVTSVVKFFPEYENDVESFIEFQEQYFEAGCGSVNHPPGTFRRYGDQVLKDGLTIIAHEKKNHCGYSMYLLCWQSNSIRRSS